MSMKFRTFGFITLLIAQVFSARLVAAADAPPVLVPSYATDDEHIEGRIAHIEGKYTLSVRDDRGFIDHVRLHQGTVINPIGLTLADGMRVRIFGHPADREFLADEVETPYRHYGYGPYAPPYAPYGYPYAYPYYGYGPGIDTTVIIDGGRHWHR